MNATILIFMLEERKKEKKRNLIFIGDFIENSKHRATKIYSIFST